MAKSMLKTRKYQEELCKALNLNSSDVRRIIIDVNTDSLVVVYVEMYGTTQLLNIKLPDEFDVEILKK